MRLCCLPHVCLKDRYLHHDRELERKSYILYKKYVDTNNECFVLEPETIPTKKSFQRVIFDDHILFMLKVLLVRNPAKTGLRYQELFTW